MAASAGLVLLCVCGQDSFRRRELCKGPPLSSIVFVQYSVGREKSEPENADTRPCNREERLLHRGVYSLPYPRDWTVHENFNGQAEFSRSRITEKHT